MNKKVKQACVAVAVGLVAVNPFNEYKELDTPKGDEYSTIVCVVGNNEDYKQYGYDDLYVPCLNVYNEYDDIHIDKEGLEEGDTLAVTFEHDDVYKIEKIEEYKIIVK